MAGIVIARPPGPSKGRRARARDTTIETYKQRRDFTVTSEPPARAAKPGKDAPIFVVQKHAARRLHWDFRLEHDGVLWSWAVPKGPSLDPHDKRLAVHVENHPLDYADFQGAIPAGEYGAGTVETWDRGTWQPLGDPAADMRRGEIKFVLAGSRLNGGFVLVRLKPRPNERGENWLLIKEHDADEREGADAAALEARPLKAARKAPAKTPAKSGAQARAAAALSAATSIPPADQPPAAGATRAALPERQAPQLATAAEDPPAEPGWISEVKFDGYRLLAFVRAGQVSLVTRQGHDWTARMPAIARAVERLGLDTALLDGELVALGDDGVSNFGRLQDALANGRDADLNLYLFDLLHLGGWDLRACRLVDRKTALRRLTSDWGGTLRYSDDLDADARGVQVGQMLREACALGLEGIVCKKVSAPYRAGRSGLWLKLKCRGRDEFVVLGWTPPAGSRTGLGSLHMGFYDENGGLHYAGGVGTGFSERELTDLRKTLEQRKAGRPAGLLYAGEPPDRTINWVRPELVAEVQYMKLTEDRRLRHAAYLGLREDKSPEEVVMPVSREGVVPRALGKAAATRIVRAVPPKAGRKPPHTTPAAGSREGDPGEAKSGGKSRAGVTVHASAPSRGGSLFEGVKLTHPDRELWPGISKRNLAEYWRAVAEHALPEIAHRPLALVRCPDGIAGQHFFQKHGKPGFPSEIRAGEVDGAPYLVIDDITGLVACAQVAAIELHAWGATEAEPLRPDRLVFDLDPGDGVEMAQIVAAAEEVRARLGALGLTGFCRTSGGKGLHVVVPLTPSADWPTARAWCRDFAEAMERDSQERFVASVPKARRHGRILVDWLRNGLGSTAVASLSPRARPGAGVATRLAWREVTDKLDPAAFTIATVPDRLRRQRKDPWSDFAQAARPLPKAST